MQTLHRILRRLNLQRNRPDDLSIARLLSSLETELRASGHNLGCRGMRQRLLSRYGLILPRDMVLEGQRLLDPEVVEGRKRHRLRRRLYRNPGPNAVHIDQNDKLKRYGFLHGARDGSSALYPDG